MKRYIGALFFGLSVITSAQTPAPPLTKDSLIYRGAFRVPLVEGRADARPNIHPPEYREMDHLGGSTAIAIRDSERLFIATRRSRVAQIRIPAPAIATTLQTLPMAEAPGGYLNPVDDAWGADGEPESLSGFLGWNGNFVITGPIYYDANNTQRRGHKLIAGPWRTVGDERRQGMIAGYLAHVPEKYRELLGPVCGGQASVPIASRTSLGPSAWCFDPELLRTQQTVPAKFVVGYPYEHPTLGSFNGTNERYGIATRVSALAIIDDSMVFLGSNGLGPACYGNGTSDQALAGTRGPDGEPYCYDPTSSAKANHAFPYRAQAWVYPMAEIAQVVAGNREPWSLIPSVFELELPFATGDRIIGGGTYDPATRRLYVSQYNADTTQGLEAVPIIHVFEIRAAAPPTTTDPPVPQPSPLEVMILELRSRIQALENFNRELIEKIRGLVVPR